MLVTAFWLSILLCVHTLDACVFSRDHPSLLDPVTLLTMVAKSLPYTVCRAAHKHTT